VSKIELTTFGADIISEDTIAVLEGRFSSYSKLDKRTKLFVNQTKNKVVNNLEYMEELRTRDSLDLMSQKEKIVFLEDRLQKLMKLERNYFQFEDLSKEVKVNYENLQNFSYSNVIQSNFSKIDTISVFSLKWIDSLTTDNRKSEDLRKIKTWLKLKLKLDTLVVKDLN